MMDDSLFIKVIVVGDSGVGKTSILNQYCYDSFDTSVIPTIGCDFSLKLFKDFEGRTVRLQLWDIAGQDRYASASRLYMKGALGCIIVADVLNPESLTGALKWRNVIFENSEMQGTKPPVVLLQNKIDLIKKEEGEENKDGRMQQINYNSTIEYFEDFAKEHEFDMFYRVSAKSSSNLSLAIEMLMSEIIEATNANTTFIDGPDQSIIHKNIKLRKGFPEADKKNSCC